MGKMELKLPKMGESVAEATITSWLKEIGDTVELDEVILEIATDKVDSEILSEVDGVLIEKRFNENDVVQIGEVLGVIETEKETDDDSNVETPHTEVAESETIEQSIAVENLTETINIAKQTVAPVISNDNRFYSPLVKTIAKKENVSQQELDAIKGTGKAGRVTKNDILEYIENRTGTETIADQKIQSPIENSITFEQSEDISNPVFVTNGEDEVIEMTRMGKLISHHMLESIKTSAHVQSFIEADVTNLWNWRKRAKDDFMKREGENLTFTPVFMEVVAKSLRDYPMMNISLQGDTIVKKKSINLGMAAALPDGNLIVPVIKNADQLNLVGMAKQVNDLANRARLNQLKPDEVQGGTYTVTNVGSFGSLMGTPIINQPQVGILALGAIRKVPAVIETPEGDFIGIRYKMFLTHSYDHRVVNGALGGMFVKAVKDYLEAWDIDREI